MEKDGEKRNVITRCCFAKSLSLAFDRSVSTLCSGMALEISKISTLIFERSNRNLVNEKYDQLFSASKKKKKKRIEGNSGILIDVWSDWKTPLYNPITITPHIPGVTHTRATYHNPPPTVQENHIFRLLSLPSNSASPNRIRPPQRTSEISHALARREQSITNSRLEVCCKKKERKKKRERKVEEKNIEPRILLFLTRGYRGL